LILSQEVFDEWDDWFDRAQAKTPDSAGMLSASADPIHVKFRNSVARESAHRLKSLITNHFGVR
jgi:hypothetical protein